MGKEELKNYNVELFDNDITDPEFVHNQLLGSYYSGLETKASEKLGKMYKYSNYIVDPNRYRFRKVLRIVALVLKFINKIRLKMKGDGIHVPSGREDYHLPALLNLCHNKFLVTEGTDPILKSPSGLVVELHERDLLESLYYFFGKSTRELKHFVRPEKYSKISTEKGGILFYSGRILPSQKIENKSGLNLSDACIDLTASTFCVPLVDKHSPLAYALINEVHWHDPDAKHSGNETVMRHLLKVCYVLEGSSLVQLFRKNCARCWYVHKKSIEVAMGPKCSENLSVAPAFYYCQVDLVGSFNAYSNSNKRATVKIWFAIFCCTVTWAIDLKVLEDYSTSSFVLAFVRFSCTFG